LFGQLIREADRHVAISWWSARGRAAAGDKGVGTRGSHGKAGRLTGPKPFSTRENCWARDHGGRSAAATQPGGGNRAADRPAGWITIGQLGESTWPISQVRRGRGARVASHPDGVSAAARAWPQTGGTKAVDPRALACGGLGAWIPKGTRSGYVPGSMSGGGSMPPKARKKKTGNGQWQRPLKSSPSRGAGVPASRPNGFCQAGTFRPLKPSPGLKGGFSAQC